MDETICPYCKSKLVQPVGRSNSRVLIIGESPDTMELNTSKAWIGEKGEVLRSELRRAGVNFAFCRATHLWLHTPTSGAKEMKELKSLCYNFCYDRLIDQIIVSKVILLLGSELVSIFTDQAVSKVNGTRVYTGSIKTINPNAAVFTSFSPGIVLQENGVVGDFRLAISRFAVFAAPVIQEMRHE